MLTEKDITKMTQHYNSRNSESFRNEVVEMIDFCYYNFPNATIKEVLDAIENIMY